MTDGKLEDLTGATLDDVTVDWRNGIVRITFLAPAGKRAASAVRATEFSHVEVPRGGAGASRRVKVASQAGNTIAIEMESGETLRVTAERFAVDQLGG
jgi:hypothetical protein